MRSRNSRSIWTLTVSTYTSTYQTIRIASNWQEQFLDKRRYFYNSQTPGRIAKMWLCRVWSLKLHSKQDQTLYSGLNPDTLWPNSIRRKWLKSLKISFNPWPERKPSNHITNTPRTHSVSKKNLEETLNSNQRKTNHPELIYN